MTAHRFMTSLAEFDDGSLQTVAYCPNCKLLVPVGAHFLKPCIAARAAVETVTAWPTPPKGGAQP